MTRAPLLAAALLTATALAASAASAAPAPTDEPKPFKASFIGEGGGFQESDPATDDYLQGGLRPGPDGAPPAAAPTPAPAPSPAAPAAPAPVVRAPAPRPASPTVAPAPAVASAPRPASPARRETAQAAAPSAAPSVPAARASLWNGLVKPLGMASRDATDADPDAARAAGDRDYETHILGMADEPSRPALADPQPPASSRAPEALVAGASSSDAGSGRVFVTLTLDAREAGTLRDAVAGLGSAAGFTADPRFQMSAAPGGRTLLSGWLPASRLADALSRPGVKRLSLEPRARPSRPREASSPYLVGLRLRDPARARASVDEGVKALADATGFQLTRVVGLETGPDGRAVAVVAGDLPISRLSRAMGLSQVAKIVPDGAPAPAAPSPASRRGGLAGFGRFALDRGPWLIVLTLLLALPSIREPLRRAVTVLNPYR